MAGVGFELKKLFRSRGGYMNTLKAYGVTAVVTEGPMVLSMVMLFVIRRLLRMWGAVYGTQEIYLITTTYIMIFSLILSNTFLMFVSRFISDCIYEEKKEYILSSFFSIVCYLLVLGALVGGIYVLLLDIPAIHKLLNFLQFEVMLVLWVQMSYLSAIKKYTKILTGFLWAALAAIGLSLLGMLIGIEPLTAAYLGSTIGYFVLMILYLQEMLGFYPPGRMSLVVLFPYLDKYKSLIAVGFFTALGLFGHNFVFWFSEYRIEVIERMIYCMKYDVACFYASLTIIPFLVIFVVALEVSFYKTYRKYFDTILYGGTLADIQSENKNMAKTLFRELAHVFELQFFVEMLCITFLGNFLQSAGFDREMLIIFRYLCIGYCFYVMVKSLIILFLYFDSRRSALLLATMFALLSILFSIISLPFGIETYGLGFLAAGAVTAVVGLLMLRWHLRRLEYQVFCRQPLFYEEPKGIFKKISDYVERKDAEIFRSREERQAAEAQAREEALRREEEHKPKQKGGRSS